MKMLITNQKCIVCALLTTFIIFSAMNIAWALSVNERTQQVQDAIVAAVDGVSAAADVTDTHLAAITTLSLYGKEISTLKTGDFSGLSSLTTLYLDNNRLTSLPDDVFSGLSSLRYLYLNNNQLNNLPATLFSSLSSIEEISLNGNRLARLPDNLFTGLTSLRQLMLHKNLLKSLDADTFSGLSSLEYLYLHNNQLTSLPANLFSKLALLKHMLLHNNQLTRLSPGMFRELSTPRLLWLQGNVVNPLSLNISVVKVSENQFKVIVPAGAPFDMNIPLTVTNGSITNGASSVTIAAGTVESKPFIVARALDTTNAVTVDTGTLPSPPMFHFGYVLVNYINTAPVFTEGTSTTRSVAENTETGTNIGAAVVATDADDDPLTYTLSGNPDAASFAIDNTTGQLKIETALDYEIKSTYTVVVTVSDGEGGSDSISVTINVADVNETPVFADGTTTTRAIVENVGADINIGTVVNATDPDTDDSLTYTLDGTNAASFAIDDKTGQLKTKAALDYETKSSYSVMITVSDGTLTDSITVTINVTNLDETPSNNPPIFDDGEETTRSIDENSDESTDIGSPISATDADNNTLAYLLSGDDASSFDIVSTTGQLKTKAALNYENENTYIVTVTVLDGSSTDTIDVTINVSDVNEAPVFAKESVTRNVAENTAENTSIGSAITATDPDSDTLEYSLGGTDSASFDIVNTTGQLKTKAALDYETKISYSVTITASDDNLTDTISVTINVTDVNENRAPVFSQTSPISLSILIESDTASGDNIGAPVTATDPDNDTLTYSLGGDDASFFSIVSSTGQLQTTAAFLSDTKVSYSITVIANDGKGGTDSINVTVRAVGRTSQQVVNSAPEFTDGDRTTRSVAENTAAGENIGTLVAATDADTNDTLIYTLSGDPDAAAFSIVSTSGQLQTSAALDYETKSSYSVTVSVSDGNGSSDSIAVTISVTDVDENRAPTFTGSSITFSIADIADASVGDSIGIPITATDLDDDTLEYSLSGDDASKFSIDSSSGQLKITQTFIDDTSTSYSIKVIATDPDGATAEISVTITVPRVSVVTNPVTPLVFLPQVVRSNSAPAFEGTSTTRSITENTASGENIGVPVTATDSDIGDTLTYSLEGTDAESFSIVTTSGQLQTSAALDFENKPSYEVTVKVTDDSGASNNSATITVTINVSDVNEAPTFLDGESVALSVNKGERLSTSIRVTDDDDDTLEYSLGGPDVALFSIINKDTEYYVPSTNKKYTEFNVQSNAALDYDGKTSYSVTITVSDSNGESDIITVTITDPAPEVTIYTMIGYDEPDWVLKLDTETGIVSASICDECSFFTSLRDTSSVSFTRPPGVKFDNSFTVVINLSEEVSGFEKADLTLTNNTAGATISHWAGHEKLSGWIVYAEVNVTMSGSVTLEVAAGAATDGSGNSNAAAESKTVNVTITLTDYPPWDVDEDGSVDDDDTALVTAALGQSGADIVNERTDVNWDDTVDADDVALVTYHISGGAPSIIGTFSLLDKKTLEKLDPVVLQRQLDILRTESDGSSRYLRAIAMVESVLAAIRPNKTQLLANYPNPSNPETWIPYQLAKPADVSLTIYNVKGVVVRQLKLGQQQAGIYHSRSRAAHWDGKNESGESVASGVYFYVFKAGKYTAMRKMLIRK